MIDLNFNKILNQKKSPALASDIGVHERSRTSGPTLRSMAYYLIQYSGT